MSPISNEARCTSCHAGYGWKDSNFDFSDKSKIDCLVCHDTTGTYKKEPTKAGMPVDGLDLKNIAENVGHTSRASCGSCHFNGGGGDAIKHADLSRNLLKPSRSCDVHMGGYDFSCVECHKTKKHKIAGSSSSVPVSEGRVKCSDCHSEKPHSNNELLSHHLNNHSKSIDCNTCHSPVYAKCKPTKVWWDWSKAGDKKRKPKNDKYGMPDYNWKKGEFKWSESEKPAYVWYSGYMQRVLIGDKVDISQKRLNMTSPVGSINDENSKITPFKIMKGVQPIDSVNKYFIVPHLFPRDKKDKTAYWKNLDWQKSFVDGMQAANLPYSGKYEWKATWMYWRIEHEVMPKEDALSCVQCHFSLKAEKSCDRCHINNKNIDFKKLSAKGTDFERMLKNGRDVKDLIGKTNYINFEELGYKGDPIIYGGRFKKLPIQKDK